MHTGKIATQHEHERIHQRRANGKAVQCQRRLRRFLRQQFLLQLDFELRSGALGAAILGIILFHEPVTMARMGFLALLVVALVGLKMTSNA